jgi:plasmid stabilization system protein ParE
LDYKVEFTDSFLADLEQIVRKIAEADRRAAARLGESIVFHGEALAFFPERNPHVRQRPALRRYIVARHFKVFYRVRSETRVVEILRCWDGRRGTDPTIPDLPSGLHS